jgi:hypothetical protein
VLAYHLLRWVGKRLETQSDTRATGKLGIDWKAAFPTKKTEIPA